MDAVTPPPRPRAAAALVAGLHSGIVAVIWMLAWLGASAAWQQRSFWTAENLMASAFYGAGAIHSGFAGRTVSGLALYLVLYGILGALFAVVVSDRLSRLRTYLVAMVFALVWYYVTFRLLWKSLLPLVALLHVERTTAFGHLIYGAALGGYRRRLVAGGGGQAQTVPGPPEEGTTPAPAQSSSEPDPASQSENS